MKTLSIFLPCIFLLLAATILNAQDPVTVKKVDFERQKFTGSKDYLRAAVTVEGGRPLSTDSRYNERIGVTLSLAFKKQGRTPGHVFFQAGATAVAVEQNEEAIFLFYLPPEIVDIYNIQSEPFAWMVELAVGDQAVPLRRDNVSGVLRAEAPLNSFRNGISLQKDIHEGVLLPIYLTPFYQSQSSEMRKNSPSYIIKQAD